MDQGFLAIVSCGMDGGDSWTRTSRVEMLVAMFAILWANGMIVLWEKILGAALRVAIERREAISYMSRLVGGGLWGSCFRGQWWELVDQPTSSLSDLLRYLRPSAGWKCLVLGGHGGHGGVGCPAEVLGAKMPAKAG